MKYFITWIYRQNLNLVNLGQNIRNNGNFQFLESSVIILPVGSSLLIIYENTKFDFDRIIIGEHKFKYSSKIVIFMIFVNFLRILALIKWMTSITLLDMAVIQTSLGWVWTVLKLFWLFHNRMKLNHVL